MQPPLQPFRIRLNHRWQSDYCFYVLALTLQYGLHWCSFPKLSLVRQPQFPYCERHLTSKGLFLGAGTYPAYAKFLSCLWL